MPGMSGHEVARRVRLEAWGKHAVLIALTGWGQDQDKQAAVAAGFDAHMTKPVEPSEVEQRLADLLQTKAAKIEASSGSLKNA
jgi:CheY-like chemotaxis protein